MIPRYSIFLLSSAGFAMSLEDKQLLSFVIFTYHPLPCYQVSKYCSQIFDLQNELIQTHCGNLLQQGDRIRTIMQLSQGTFVRWAFLPAWGGRFNFFSTWFPDREMILFYPLLGLDKLLLCFVKRIYNHDVIKILKPNFWPTKWVKPNPLW